MVRIATAGNTQNPALLVLKAKGYSLRIEFDDDAKSEDTVTQWWAERDGNDFIAQDPTSLLGLVTIWENRGDNWQTHDDEPFLLDELFESTK